MLITTSNPVEVGVFAGTEDWIHEMPTLKNEQSSWVHLRLEILPELEELEHLQIMGGYLPNPKSGAGLPKLSTLLDVSAQCCSKKVLKRIPNLQRLGIRIELAPNDKGNPFRCLNRIARLGRIESLKCVMVSPQIGSNGVAPPPPISMFPSSFKTLSLSGFGYPLEHKNIIGQLKSLEVLKLEVYAFQGPKWNVGKWDMEYPYEFDNLKFLLIEDTNIDALGNQIPHIHRAQAYKH